MASCNPLERSVVRCVRGSEESLTPWMSERREEREEKGEEKEQRERREGGEDRSEEGRERREEMGLELSSRTNLTSEAS